MNFEIPPTLTPEERAAAELAVERNRMRWIADQFLELAVDMVNNKAIPHNYIIVAMGLAKFEFTAGCVAAAKPQN